MQENEETKSGFLFKNLVRGLLGFAIFITAFIFFEDYIEQHFQSHIQDFRANGPLLYGIFTLSEIVFGILPPELFMLVWVTSKATLAEYTLNLANLTLISYGAGILGYFIGKFFSKAPIYKHMSERYLDQYKDQLKRFGGYLVLVGAITPLPFSATCMLAGSVNYPFRTFLLISVARVMRFAVYGWMVWSFPNWFS
ncbi:MAG: VTT domain-containing protein [Cyclobacteriaceae bacterium]|nr:VTT domain-containing protein [Cyclobacteriaceae bacterium]MDH4294632.1 VTT domain-containing protein [Cyclobacteriaceae bacterium]MDH5247534.1 VTT domain-containing protein [Cyclobacteriaceae bacterium]